jgi:hypothetical protein
MKDQVGSGQWVVSVNVRLTDPLTDVQQRKLERVMLAVDVRSPRAARLHVAVHGPLQEAIDRALRVCRQALVAVDAWFERVDVFDVHGREEWPRWQR